jgi:hypothetical protein
MRKITADAISAFEAGVDFKTSNTSVKREERGGKLFISLRYHGNEIAFYEYGYNSSLVITNCGYFTNTTKERLNGISGVHIRQRNFAWYLNGVEWDGSKTKLSEWKSENV